MRLKRHVSSTLTHEIEEGTALLNSVPVPRLICLGSATQRTCQTRRAVHPAVEEHTAAVLAKRDEDVLAELLPVEAPEVSDRGGYPRAHGE